MKKLLLFWAATLSCVVFAYAQPPANYYSTASGKSGYTLKTALYNIIKGHTVVSYGDLYKVYEGTFNASPASDKKANGKVWDMYSDVPGGTSPYEYSWGQTCGNYSSEGDCYNREHSFPQSWFAQASPMVSDAFHIYPTDGKVNGLRSNYPYGKVGTASTTTQNGSKLGSSASAGYTGIVFEPRDEYKGDLARSMFYMATRYENLIGSWKSNGTADNVLDGSTGQAFDSWFLNQMYAWHKADPVSQKEIDRNNAIFGSQGNRNPYIDNPNWVNEVWQLESADPLVQFAAFSASIQENVSGDRAYTIDVVINKTTYTPFTVNISVDGAGTTALSPADYTLNTTSLSFNGSETSKQVSITVKSDAITEPDETLKITLGSPSAPAILLGATTAHILTIKDASSPPEPIVEAFDPCDLDSDWKQVSITGPQAWSCSTSGRTGGGAGMNGFSGAAVPNQDWLISPVINLGTGATITYWSKGDFSGPGLELYVLSGYSGTGDPTANATKVTAATFPTPSGNSAGTWTQSLNISLAGFEGSSKYIAFKYTSNTGSNAAARWTIDDVSINQGGTPPSTPSLSVNATSLTFNTTQGTASAQQSYTVTGSNLTGNVTVTAPTNFEVSLSSSTGYATSVSIAPVSGAVNQLVYVRIAASALAGNLSASNVSNASAGVATVNVSVSGTVAAAGSPTLSASIANLSFNTIFGTASTDKSYTLTGSNLTGNVTVTAPTNFEVSLSKSTGYAGSIIIPASGSLSPTTVYVRIVASAPLGSLSAANITNASNSATTANVSVSGTVNSVGGATVVFDKPSSSVKEGNESNILLSFSEATTVATNITIQATRGVNVEYGSTKDFVTIPASNNDITTLSIPAGVSSVIFSAKANFDATSESNENISFRISGTGSGLVIGSSNTHTLTIEDTDVINAVENIENQEISIYPNPAQNEIFIQTGKQEFEVALHNMQGQLILKSKSTDALPVGNQPNGLYLVKLSNKNGTIVKKITIQK